MANQKIIYIITKATYGGAQRYVRDLVRSLPKERFEAVIAHGVPGPLSETLSREGYRTARIPSLGRDIAFFDDVSSFFELLRCLRAERPDIVHLNSSKAAALGALAARIARTPNILFTVHGWPYKESRFLLFRALLFGISWFTALLSTHVIVVSKIDEESGKRMWGVRKKIRYIPVGIDPPVFLSQQDALSSIWQKTSSDKIPAHSIRIGTIAELTANKGIRYGIEAIAELHKYTKDNYIYLIIGEGEEREELQRLARNLGLEDKVFFLGFVAEAARLMYAFDIFLLPSIKEGMPYVLLEAGESGIPTLTTHAVNPDLLEHYENIRSVAPGNAAVIAQMIPKITSIARNREYRVGRFTLSKMVDATVALYETRAD